jgi:hypothetical protein
LLQLQRKVRLAACVENMWMFELQWRDWGSIR